MLGISFRNRCGITASGFAELAGCAERAGFEHLVFTEWFNDVIAYLVAAAATTDRARLWSGVANVGLRHPLLMASGAAVVDDVSDGRCILGLGTGNEWHGEDRYDTQPARPLGLMREYVEVVRKAWCFDTIAHPGPRFPITGARLSFAPRHARLPIFLAALGPRMIELAGGIADGVFVHMAGPEDLTTIRTRLMAGEEQHKLMEMKTGRWVNVQGGGSTTLAALLVLCVGERQLAKHTAREAVVAYLGYDSYQRHVRRLGYASALPQIVAALNSGDPLVAARLVPDELVDRVCAYGPVGDCQARIAEYYAAGADVVVLSTRPVVEPGAQDPSPETWRATYQQVIDQFGPAGRR